MIFYRFSSWHLQQEPEALSSANKVHHTLQRRGAERMLAISGA
jgi:hypothetical protein